MFWKLFVVIFFAVVSPAISQVTKVEYRNDDPFRGPEFAKVTIVAFSEFQCPYCKRVEPALKKIMETYGEDVKLVWKHQPLGFHRKAMPAAEAAEAAREQGKFWEMHDLLFENQQRLATIDFEDLAKQIGLDIEEFRQSISEHTNRARIQEDSRLGNSIGASGTPTFFINGRKFVGAQPYERFQAMIEKELKTADELLKKGVNLDAGFYSAIVAENQLAAGQNKQ